jgi:hypothetical protein
MKRSMLGLVVALVLAVSWPGAASAATGWTIGPMPLPTGVPHGLPTGVSCQAAGNCIAVGTGPAHTLAWHWNGSAWALTHPAVPVGATGTGLSAVSCPSALQCIAVGAQATASTPLPLAERWDGAQWHAQFTPSPGGTSLSLLAAVSCDSPNSCTAVGTAEGSSEFTLAEHWDGTAWTIQPTPSPSSPLQLTFDGVSCPSAARCLAVGYTDSRPFAESWNGSTWTLVSVPVPAGGKLGQLRGISCPSVTDCIAVGSYVNSASRAVPLAEHWNGSVWTPHSAPLPVGSARGGFLTAISCAPAATCTAVGSFSRTSVTAQALAEVWNGTTWSLRQTAMPVSHKILLSVSCTAAGTCTAAGDDTTDGGARRLALPLAEHE